MSILECSRRIGIALIAVVILAGTGGCASLAERKQEATLDQSASVYVTALRWSNFQAAAAYLRFRDGSTPSFDIERLKSVRVLSSSYELASAATDGTQATMIASFSFQRAGSASVYNVTQQALWWYEPETERWYLEDGFPSFQ